MTDEPQRELDVGIDPAEAFDRMRRQLALLTAAVEGFASRQQVIEARDYAPDIARLIERQERVCAAILNLANRPGVALTLEGLASRISEAGQAARQADQKLLQSQAARQHEVTQQLECIIRNARSTAQRRGALIWAALAGLIVVLVLWLVLR